MKKLNAYIEKFLELLIVTSLTITVTVTFLQVLFRYVIKISADWTQDIIMISFIYSVFFGAALAVKNKEHLTVDLLDKAPQKVKNITRTLEVVVVGTMIIIFIIYGFILVKNNFQSGQIIGSLPINIAYIFISLPISGLFMLYFHIRGVIKWFL